MFHPLDGPRLKVGRAVAQIDGLRRRQEVLWKDRKHKIIRAEVNPKTGKDVYRASGDFSLSLDWGVSIGEITHNLRSALDGVAYALAVKNRASEEALARTYFPIFLLGRTTRRRPRKAGRSKGQTALIPHFFCDGLKQIDGLSRKHQATIERLQPYHRVVASRAHRTTHPLYWLHEINNADKHRVIQVVGYRVGGMTSGAWTDDPFDGLTFRRGTYGIVLKDRAKVFEAPRNVNVNPHFIPLVAFAEGSVGVKNMSVTGRLSSAAKAVTEIIDSFWGEF